MHAAPPDQVPTVRFCDVSKHYKDTVVLDSISTTLEPGTIYGLLGRNGAGKTTLMSILHAQSFPSSGSVTVGGANPARSPRALEQICFIRENQRYPEQATCPSVLKTASWFFPNWSVQAAEELSELFDLPRQTAARKLSRGQMSALAATVGLASRAPISLFDEPYLGLDSLARDEFYRYLLKDLDTHPRTVLISSHLIEEIAALIDHVLLLDRGRLVIDQPTEQLLEDAHSVSGPTTLVDDFCAPREVLNRESMGGMGRYQTTGFLSAERMGQAARQGLEIRSLSLQELVTAIAASSAHKQKQVH